MTARTLAKQPRPDGRGSEYNEQDGDDFGLLSGNDGHYIDDSDGDEGRPASDDARNGRAGNEPTSFIDLRLQRSLLRQLHAFGFDCPTPIQREAIPAVLSGRDVWAVSSTGTGKTAAFLLPLMHRFLGDAMSATPTSLRQKIRPALVLEPTRELAVQCYESAQRYLASTQGPPVRVVLLAGGMPKGPQLQQLREHRHKLHLIIGTPGRVLDACQQSSGALLNLRRCATLVLDEADRLLAEGFFHQLSALKRHVTGAIDDRPSDDARAGAAADASASSTGNIGDGCPGDRCALHDSLLPEEKALAGHLNWPQVLLFSATLSDQVKELAGLLLPPSRQFCRLALDDPLGLAPHLAQQFYRVRSADELARLSTLLYVVSDLARPLPTQGSDNRVGRNGQHIIVFVNRKHNVQRVVRALQSMLALPSVFALHGNLSQCERLESLRRFVICTHRCAVLVATDVAARGLDLSSLSLSMPLDAGSPPAPSGPRSGRPQVQVDVVINYDMPATYDIYQHRVGRTARLGRSGAAISLVGSRERRLLKEAQKQAPFVHSHVRYAEYAGVRDKVAAFLDAEASEGEAAADGPLSRGEQ